MARMSLASSASIVNEKASRAEENHTGSLRLARMICPLGPACSISVHAAIVADGVGGELMRRGRRFAPLIAAACEREQPTAARGRSEAVSQLPPGKGEVASAKGTSVQAQSAARRASGLSVIVSASPDMPENLLTFAVPVEVEHAIDIRRIEKQEPFRTPAEISLPWSTTRSPRSVMS